jgi:hypothetical protein
MTDLGDRNDLMGPLEAPVRMVRLTGRIMGTVPPGDQGSPPFHEAVATTER